MTIKDRMQKFLEKKALSQRKFEKFVGLSNGFVNNIGDSIRAASLEKIKHKYPELNTNWLLTGEGEMLGESNQYITSLEKVQQDIILLKAYAKAAVWMLIDVRAEQTGEDSRVVEKRYQALIDAEMEEMKKEYEKA